MFRNRGNIRLSIIKGVLDRIYHAVKPRIAGPEPFRHQDERKTSKRILQLLRTQNPLSE